MQLSSSRPVRALVTAGIAALALSGLAACSSDEQAGDANSEEIALVIAVRGVSNPYHVTMVEGARLFAESVGADLEVLVNDGDSQKQLSQMQALAARGSNVALCVEPQTSSDARAVVETVTRAGGSVATLMNKTDDLHPWEVGDEWAAHISYDNQASSVGISTELFEAMGGSGNVVALRGVLDTPVDQLRYSGLEEAVAANPGITLLDTQTANFSRSEGLSVTQTLLNKHEGQIDGIWASNDDMALGALEALKAAGLEGQVPIVSIDGTPEALELIEAGESGYVATVSPDAAWQGAACLALAYRAAIGEYDVAAAPESDREFNGEHFVVTSENAADFLQEVTIESYSDDFADPLRRNVGQIQY